MCPCEVTGGPYLAGFEEWLRTEMSEEISLCRVVYLLSSSPL